MKIMSNNIWEEHKTEILILREENKNLKNKLKTLEDDSLVSVARRFKDLMKELCIPVHTRKYQEMAERFGLELMGRESEMLAAYSKTAFMKDNPDDIIKRVIEMTKQSSAITKQVENKGKK